MSVAKYRHAADFSLSPQQLGERLTSIVLSGDYILSDTVEEFETQFAEYLGAPDAIGVNSGTDALLIAFMALQLRPDDRVVTQANGFYATVATIALAGGRPVLVDADPSTFLWDEEQAVAAIADGAAGAVPVHLYGLATPMGRVRDAAERAEAWLVEDAAQAHGAVSDLGPVGTVGILGCFSFHPSKNLAAAGDGGAIVSSRADLSASIRKLRALGQSAQNHHEVLGINSKLDAIQAQVLLWKLPSLSKWNAARRLNAGRYRERLGDLPIRFQAEHGPTSHVYHLFQIYADKRDELLRHLQSCGIDAVVRYPTPIHLQPAFSDFGWKRGQFPVAEDLCDHLLALPIHPHLTLDELDEVCEAVRSFYGSGR